MGGGWAGWRAVALYVHQESDMSVFNVLPSSFLLQHRWGGWSSNHGVRTVVKTYESLALDQHMNVHGLAYGIGMDADIWRKRLLQFQGQTVDLPRGSYFEAGPVLPWCARLAAMALPEVVQARQACNAACVQLVNMVSHNVEVRTLASMRDTV
jgi:hypothetical protein